MKRNILVIEDDLDACQLIKDALIQVGYSVEVRHDGKSIVSMDFVLPDLFILDNKIPAIFGLALCKFLRIKPQTRHVPIIVVSGDGAIAARVQHAGANAFLCKPFQAHQLIATVQALMPGSGVNVSVSLPGKEQYDRGTFLGS